jgi:hypothetical protein
MFTSYCLRDGSIDRAKRGAFDSSPSVQRFDLLALTMSILTLSTLAPKKLRFSTV